MGVVPSRNGQELGTEQEIRERKKKRAILRSPTEMDRNVDDSVHRFLPSDSEAISAQPRETNAVLTVQDKSQSPTVVLQPNQSQAQATREEHREAKSVAAMKGDNERPQSPDTAKLPSPGVNKKRRSKKERAEGENLLALAKNKKPQRPKSDTPSNQDPPPHATNDTTHKPVIKQTKLGPSSEKIQAETQIRVDKDPKNQKKEAKPHGLVSILPNVSALHTPENNTLAPSYPAGPPSFWNPPGQQINWGANSANHLYQQQWASHHFVYSQWTTANNMIPQSYPPGSTTPPFALANNFLYEHTPAVDPRSKAHNSPAPKASSIKPQPIHKTGLITSAEKTPVDPKSKPQRPALKISTVKLQPTKKAAPSASFEKTPADLKLKSQSSLADNPQPTTKVDLSASVPKISVNPKWKAPNLAQNRSASKPLSTETANSTTRKGTTKSRRQLPTRGNLRGCDSFLEKDTQNVEDAERADLHKPSDESPADGPSRKAEHQDKFTKHDVMAPYRQRINDDTKLPMSVTSKTQPWEQVSQDKATRMAVPTPSEPPPRQQKALETPVHQLPPATSRARNLHQKQNQGHSSVWCQEQNQERASQDHADEPDWRVPNEELDNPTPDVGRFAARTPSPRIEKVPVLPATYERLSPSYTGTHQVSHRSIRSLLGLPELSIGSQDDSFNADAGEISPSLDFTITVQADSSITDPQNVSTLAHANAVDDIFGIFERVNKVGIDATTMSYKEYQVSHFPKESSMLSTIEKDKESRKNAPIRGSRENDIPAPSSDPCKGNNERAATGSAPSMVYKEDQASHFSGGQRNGYDAADILGLDLRRIIEKIGNKQEKRVKSALSEHAARDATLGLSQDLDPMPEGTAGQRNRELATLIQSAGEEKKPRKRCRDCSSSEDTEIQPQANTEKTSSSYGVSVKIDKADSMGLSLQAEVTNSVPNPVSPSWDWDDEHSHGTIRALLSLWGKEHQAEETDLEASAITFEDPLESSVEKTEHTNTPGNCRKGLSIVGVGHEEDGVQYSVWHKETQACHFGLANNGIQDYMVPPAQNLGFMSSAGQPGQCLARHVSDDRAAPLISIESTKKKRRSRIRSRSQSSGSFGELLQQTPPGKPTYRSISNATTTEGQGDSYSRADHHLGGFDCEHLHEGLLHDPLFNFGRHALEDPFDLLDCFSIEGDRDSLSSHSTFSGVNHVQRKMKKRSVHDPNSVPTTDEPAEKLAKRSKTQKRTEREDKCGSSYISPESEDGLDESDCDYDDDDELENETPRFPSTGHCHWSFDPESRIVMAKFVTGQVTWEDQRFFLHLVRRNDISLVSEGLYKNPDEKTALDNLSKSMDPTEPSKDSLSPTKVTQQLLGMGNVRDTYRVHTQRPTPTIVAKTSLPSRVTASVSYSSQNQPPAPTEARLLVVTNEKQPPSAIENRVDCGELSNITEKEKPSSKEIEDILPEPPTVTFGIASESPDAIEEDLLSTMMLVNELLDGEENEPQATLAIYELSDILPATKTQDLPATVEHDPLSIMMLVEEMSKVVGTELYTRTVPKKQDGRLLPTMETNDALDVIDNELLSAMMMDKELSDAISKELQTTVRLPSMETIGSPNMIEKEPLSTMTVDKELPDLQTHTTAEQLSTVDTIESPDTIEKEPLSTVAGVEETSEVLNKEAPTLSVTSELSDDELQPTPHNKDSPDTIEEQPLSTNMVTLAIPNRDPRPPPVANELSNAGQKDDALLPTMATKESPDTIKNEPLSTNMAVEELSDALDKDPRTHPVTTELSDMGKKDDALLPTTETKNSPDSVEKEALPTKVAVKELPEVANKEPQTQTVTTEFSNEGKEDYEVRRTSQAEERDTEEEKKDETEENESSSERPDMEEDEGNEEPRPPSTKIHGLLDLKEI